PPHTHLRQRGEELQAVLGDESEHGRPRRETEQHHAGPGGQPAGRDALPTDDEAAEVGGDEQEPEKAEPGHGGAPAPWSAASCTPASLSALATRSPTSS